MISQRLEKSESGAILFDDANLQVFPERYFEADYWKQHDLVEAEASGRGSTLIVRMQEQRWVLRHYHRGGQLGKLVSDSYLWLGQRRTRCFREWQLLADLDALELPVPKPVAARYVKKGLRYTADLITQCIPGVVTLANLLQTHPLSETTWENVGSCVRRFHEAGVYHADLNAHNIMLSTDGHRAHIIDFDRGYFRPGQGWKQDNLDRLKRSLVKVTKTRDRGFGGQEWQWLLGGYS